MVSVFNGIYYYVNNTRIASLIISSRVVKNALDTNHFFLYSGGVPPDVTMVFGIGPYPQKPPECSSPRYLLSCSCKGYCRSGRMFVEGHYERGSRYKYVLCGGCGPEPEVPTVISDKVAVTRFSVLGSA